MKILNFMWMQLQTIDVGAASNYGVKNAIV